MVGVPGRSKACKTCKQRKIACSLEKPICKICIKSKRECAGYERERIFVLDARTQETVATTPKPSTPKSPTINVPPPRKLTKELLPDLEGTISLKDAYKSIWMLQNPTTRAVYREQIISEFLYSFLPTPNAGSWLSLLPSHPHFTSALEASSLAFCTAHLGHLHHSPTLVRESLKFYTQALWELQRALWSENLMYRDETIAACMLLIMYEVTECPDRSTGAWQGHMKGCAKMFELRGPESYGHEFGHRLFTTFRQLEIQNALVEHRDTFLASPAWRDKPWKSRPKPIWQELIDIESEIARGIAEVYQMPGLGSPSSSPSSPEEFATFLLHAVKRSWELDTCLETFYKKLESQAKGELYFLTLTLQHGFNHTTMKEGGEGESCVFPMAFKFPDLLTAHTCMLYWALTCILWTGMAKIYEIIETGQMETREGKFEVAVNKSMTDISPTQVGSPTPTAKPPNSASTPAISRPAPTPPPPPLSFLPALNHRLDVSLPAKKICQSLEFCMTTPNPMPAATVFPLKVAIEALCHSGSGCERELEWAKGAFERIGGQGVKILEYLGHKVEKKTYLPG